MDQMLEAAFMNSSATRPRTLFLSLPPPSAGPFGDATPCRMTGVALHSHVPYEEI